MDLSGIKLVVADMDGTLLNSNHEVSKEFFGLYDQLKLHKVRFVAASGRQYGSIVDKLSSIAHEITIIAENGGFTVHQGEEILSNPLASHHKNIILNELDPLIDVQAVLCGKHTAYLTPSSEPFLRQLQEYYTHFNILEDLKTYEGEVMKIAVYHHLSSEEHIYPYVKHLEGELKVKVSGEHWVDLSHPDANKGHALEIVQSSFNISPAETLVFGDYNNDLEMLARSDYSFAMANAHRNVLAAARFTTASNDARGVEKVLEALLQGKF
jgi:Cof subfamily protein (haloacid dehalogenase superfamily)